MSSFALKWLALILMVIDHMGAFLPGMPIWMRYLGRCSAPLFIFTLVWGFHYTHNRGRYLLRLYLGSVTMGVLVLVLNALLPRYGEPMTANIFSTLFLIGVLICMKDRHWSDWLLFFSAQYITLMLISWGSVKLMNFGVSSAYVTVIANAFFPNVIYTEGGILFVVIGALIDRWKNQSLWLTVSYLLCCFAAYLLAANRGLLPGDLSFLAIFAHYQWMMVGALLPMLLYNRRRGKGSKKFFYIFYPAHLAVLHGFGWLLERAL